jgi:hypothetical protein
MRRRVQVFYGMVALYTSPPKSGGMPVKVWREALRAGRRWEG